MKFPKFEEVLGHDVIKDSLSKVLQSGRISHANIFYGRKGIGKSKLAHAFFYSLLGEKAINTDLLIYNCGKEGEIDELRLFLEKTKLSPLNGKYTGIIIDDAEKLSNQSANLLLKTLEEPSSGAIFILIVSENTLPSTLLSRSIKYNFSQLDTDILRELSVRNNLVVSDIAIRMAGGSFGELLSLYPKGVESTQVLDEVSNFMNVLLNGSLSERLLKLQLLADMDAKELLRILQLSYNLFASKLVTDISNFKQHDSFLKALWMSRNNFNKKVILQHLLIN